MAKFNLVVAHELRQGEAIRRVRAEIESLKKQYGNRIANLRESWDCDTYAFQATAMGVTASGTMAVKPSHVEIDADLPWYAMLLKNRVGAAIQERLRNLLS